jgi:altronate hydrolase
MHRFLKVHHGDNVFVALSHLRAGDKIEQLVLKDDIPAKHKFNIKPLKAGDPVIMYGVLVGRAVSIFRRDHLFRLTIFIMPPKIWHWQEKNNMENTLDVSAYRNRTFMGI